MSNMTFPMGTFAKSAHFQVPENGFLSAQTKKLRPLFHANIPPKWWSRHLFHVFTTFGWEIIKFWNGKNGKKKHLIKNGQPS